MKPDKVVFLDVFFDFLGLSIRLLHGGNSVIVHKHKTKDCSVENLPTNILFAPLKFGGLHNHSPNNYVQVHSLSNSVFSSHYVFADHLVPYKTLFLLQAE